jgi:hypothetical protein
LAEKVLCYSVPTAGASLTWHHSIEHPAIAHEWQVPVMAETSAPQQQVQVMSMTVWCAAGRGR